MKSKTNGDNGRFIIENSMWSRTRAFLRKGSRPVNQGLAIAGGAILATSGVWMTVSHAGPSAPLPSLSEIDKHGIALSSLPDRNALWSKLTSDDFDVLIIGGGYVFPFVHFA
jgi:hypothetical protein